MDTAKCYTSRPRRCRRRNRKAALANRPSTSGQCRQTELVKCRVVVCLVSFELISLASYAEPSRSEAVTTWG